MSVLQYAIQEWGDGAMRSYANLLLGGVANHDVLADLRDRRDELAPALFSYAAGQHVVFYGASGTGLTIYRIIHCRHDLAANFDV